MNNNNTSKPYTLDRVVRMVIAIVIIIGLYLLIQRLRSVLLPFVLGWLFAYILNPVVEFFQHKAKLKNRVLAVICTLIVVGAVLTGLVLILAPMIGTEISKMSTLIKDYTQDITVNSIFPVAWQEWFKNFISQFDIEKFLSSDELKNTIQNAAPKFWGFLSSSFSAILGFLVSLIAILYMFFIMIDYHNISDTLFNLIPEKFRELSGEIISDVGITMNRYFRGQILVAGFVGVITAIGFAIIGLPMAIVMGLFTGLLNIVPYLQALSIPPVAILGLMHCAETGQTVWSMAIGIIVVYVVAQLIQDLILVPRIMGKVTGLRPAIILLSLAIWGSLMGLIGMIIALPLTQLIISYYKRFVLKEEDTKPWENPEEEDNTDEKENKPIPIIEEINDEKDNAQI